MDEWVQPRCAVSVKQLHFSEITAVESNKRWIRSVFQADNLLQTLSVQGERKSVLLQGPLCAESLSNRCRIPNKKKKGLAHLSRGYDYCCTL